MIDERWLGGVEVTSFTDGCSAQVFAFALAFDKLLFSRSFGRNTEYQ